MKVTERYSLINPHFQTNFTELSKLTPTLSRPIEPKILSGDLKDCHSSTQVEIHGDHFVAFKGRRPDDEGKGIWLKKVNSKDPATELVSAPNKQKNCYSPVFDNLPDFNTLLFYRVGPGPDQLTSHALSNEGSDWLPRGNIPPAGFIGPTKTKPYQIKDGAAIFGSSTEKGSWTFDGSKQGVAACHTEIVLRTGKWIRSENLQMPDGYDQKRGGAIEPALFPYGNKRAIGMLCRNRNRWVNGAPQENGKGGWALFSVSEDGGINWSQLQESQLRNPDTSLDIVDLGNGKLIVFYNDSHESRDRLSFALSSNGGVTWSNPCLLVEKEGEFPSAILLQNGHISVTYADKKGQLNHITIDPTDIKINNENWT